MRRARAGPCALVLSLAAVSAVVASSAACRGPGFDRDSLSLSGAWALYPLAVRWQEEFQRVRPEVKIDIQAGGAGKGVADVLAGAVDIGMVSRAVHPAEAGKGAVAVPVAIDAVVATLSAENPFLAEILRHGLDRATLRRIWIEGTVRTWEQALGRGGGTPLHLTTRPDACGAAETWAAYIGGHQEDLGGIGVYGDPGLAEAVRRDPLALGFNNLNFAYDARTLRPIDGIVVCPLDLDGSGAIEPSEAFTASRDDLTRAIAAGAYPSPPARELYFVIKGGPLRPVVREFLEWVLGGGQAFVAESGYVPLSAERVAGAKAALRGGGGRPG